MKTLLSLMVVSLLFVSCSKKDNVKLESFSTEAFAFNTGAAWDVNVTSRVKGFQINEANGKYTGSVSYQIDLIKPNGEAMKGLVSRVEDISNSERVNDVPLESQFELDSTYTAGVYKIVMNVKDVLSGKTAASETKFELKKD